ncbi:prostatic spermine-binding protein-like [Triticum aestivum]|uniref:prostatic spermine-binding protein-like n=1 Tax=Triticum aestivum TaxID=4565 RepID=UPI001D016F36|nr:prostatic spermine-binding protein-like [Triticum aestivum]
MDDIDTTAEETSFTADDNGRNDVGRTDNDHSNEEDDNSDNDSWSSYDILPSEDFSNNEHGADSENEDVDVGNEQNNFEESWADNLSQEGSDGPDSGDDEAELDIEEAQYQQRVLETRWKVMAMTFRSQGDAYIFYNRHAKEHGFNIRREKVKRGKGASGLIWFRRFFLL